MPRTRTTALLRDGVLTIKSIRSHAAGDIQRLLARLRHLPGVFCYQTSGSIGGRGVQAGWASYYQFHWTAPDRMSYKTSIASQKALFQAVVAEFDPDPDFDFIRTSFHIRKSLTDPECDRFQQVPFASLTDYSKYDAAVAALPSKSE